MDPSMSDGKKTFRREQFTDFPWSDASLSRHIVFVGLLPKTTTRQKLSLYFSSFGRVAWLELFAPAAGDEYAYAHLLFDELQAVDLLFETGSHRIDGAAVRVRMWKTPTDTWHSEALLNKRTVFVKNIAPKTSSMRLREYFRRFGEVAAVEPGPRSRGACAAIAHVVFSTPEGAYLCLNASHERIDGFKIKCKPFVPVTSDLAKGAIQLASPRGPEESLFTAEEYSSIIRKCEKGGLLRPQQQQLQKQPQEKRDRKIQGLPARGPTGLSTFKSRSITSLEGRCTEARAVQKTFNSADSRPVQAAAAAAGPGTTPAWLRRPLKKSDGLLPTTSTHESWESPPHELLITCSLRRPVYVNYFLVDGYI